MQPLSNVYPLGLTDPRQSLDENALTLASQNAYPIVATRSVRKDRMGLALGSGIALLLGGLTFWSMTGNRETNVPRIAQPTATAKGQVATTEIPQTALTIAAEDTAAMQGPAQPVQALPPMPQTPVLSAAPQQMPQINRAAAPVMVLDMTSGYAPKIDNLAPTPGIATTQTPQGLSENEAFASRVGTGTVDTAQASYLINPAHTVTQGTMIPAILETAVDSDLPGFVRAIVSQDVLSFDGKRILIPRSSRLIGQYKSGLSAGQTRIYILWTRLIRSDGASVAIASPATDFEGRSGLPGEVHSHFMKRFGSAMLLTVVGAVGAIGNAGLLLSGSQSASSVAAQRDSQIPPTIRVRPGQPIRIFTARDLDFSAIRSETLAK